MKRFLYGVLLVLAGIAILLAIAARNTEAQTAGPDAALAPSLHAEIAPAPPGLDASDVSASAHPETEEALMARLRAEVEATPVAAHDLAERIEREFPGSPMADERAFLSMQALVHLQRIAAARSEATVFYERFPESPLGERVHRLTGMHRRPKPPARR